MGVVGPCDCASNLGLGWLCSRSGMRGPFRVFILLHLFREMTWHDDNMVDCVIKPQLTYVGKLSKRFGWFCSGSGMRGPFRVFILLHLFREMAWHDDNMVDCVIKPQLSYVGKLSKSLGWFCSRSRMRGPFRVFILLHLFREMAWHDDNMVDCVIKPQLNYIGKLSKCSIF